MIDYFLALILGYGLGSIPFGLIFTRLAGLGDVRAIGSGNIGATNVLRTGRKDIAALTLLFDALKASLAIFVAEGFIVPFADAHGTPHLFLLPLITGLGAFIGHLFPLWLKFKGGKGVATFLGVTLGLSPLTALAFAGSWLIVAFVTRYSSLAALIASVAATAFAFVLENMEIGILFACVACLLFFTHRANISRLLAGQEGKIGAKS